MDNKDLWLKFSNNELKKLDLKQGVRRSDIAQNLQGIFDLYDNNRDGLLENRELGSIFQTISEHAGADNTFDVNENVNLSNIFSTMGFEKANMQEFVAAIDAVDENILVYTESEMLDGGHKIITKYTDGSTETRAYYPDGEIKYIKREYPVTENHYYVRYNDSSIICSPQEISKEEYDVLLANLEEITPSSTMLDSSLANINLQFQTTPYDLSCTETNHMETDFKLSNRAQLDIYTRESVVNHFIDSYSYVQEQIDSLGWLDYAGATLDTAWEETTNFAENCWNQVFNDKEWRNVDNFYDQKEDFESVGDSVAFLEKDMNIIRARAEMGDQEAYFDLLEASFSTATGNNYDNQKAFEFDELAVQYQAVSALEMRLEYLEKARDALSPSVFEDETNYWDYLIMAYGVNEDTVNYLLEELKKYNENAVVYDKNSYDIRNREVWDWKYRFIDQLKQEAEEQLDYALRKRVFVPVELKDGSTAFRTEVSNEKYSVSSLRNEYCNAYKDLYNTDIVPDEILENVNDAKTIGGFVKMGIIILIQVLITKGLGSAGVSGATGTASTAATGGRMSQCLNTLVNRYGQAAVRQSIRFSMATGAIAMDVGLTLLNQLTDNRPGIETDELIDTALNSAKYIYFGAYVAGPVAESFAGCVNGSRILNNIFARGTKVVNGSTTTTTVSGKTLLEGMKRVGNGTTTFASGAVRFGTNVAMFTGLELATSDVNPFDAFTQQGSTFAILEVMNNIFAYMLGVNAHAAPNRMKILEPKMELALKKSGVENWNIREHVSTDANGNTSTTYTIDIAGVPYGKEFKSSEQLVTEMVGRVSQVYDAMKVLDITTPEDMNNLGSKYRQKAKECHPDKFGGDNNAANEAMQKVNEAKALLEDCNKIEQAVSAHNNMAATDGTQTVISRPVEYLEAAPDTSNRPVEQSTSQSPEVRLEESATPRVNTEITVKRTPMTESDVVANLNRLVNEDTLADLGFSVSEINSLRERPDVLAMIYVYKHSGTDIRTSEIAEVLSMPEIASIDFCRNIEAIVEKSNGNPELLMDLADGLSEANQTQIDAILRLELGENVDISREVTKLNYVPRNEGELDYSKLFDLKTENGEYRFSKYDIDAIKEAGIKPDDTAKLDAYSKIQNEVKSDNNRMYALLPEKVIKIVTDANVDNAIALLKNNSDLSVQSAIELSKSENIDNTIQLLNYKNSTNYRMMSNDIILELSKPENFANAKQLLDTGRFTGEKIFEISSTGKVNEYIEFCNYLQGDKVKLTDDNICSLVDAGVTCRQYEALDAMNKGLSQQFEDVQLFNFALDKITPESITKLTAYGYKTFELVSLMDEGYDLNTACAYIEYLDTHLDKSGIKQNPKKIDLFTTEQFETLGQLLKSDEINPDFKYEIISNFVPQNGAYSHYASDLSYQDFVDLSKAFENYKSVPNIYIEIDNFVTNVKKTDVDFAIQILNDQHWDLNSQYVLLCNIIPENKEIAKRYVEVDQSDAQKFCHTIRCANNENADFINYCIDTKQYLTKQQADHIATNYKNEADFLNQNKEFVAAGAQEGILDPVKIIKDFDSFRDIRTFDELDFNQSKQLLSMILAHKNELNFFNSDVVKRQFPLLSNAGMDVNNILNGLKAKLNIPLEPANEAQIRNFNTSIENLYSRTGDLNIRELQSVMPEVFARFNNGELPEATINALHQIFNNPKFRNLSDSDKKLLTFATMMHEAYGDDVSHSAFDAYFIAKKYGMTDYEAQKVVNIIETSNAVSQFMNTTKDIIHIPNALDREFIMQDRDNTFNVLAYRLRNGNDFELAQMLYSTKEIEGFTRYFDQLLGNRVREIQSTSFTLPQTPASVYHQNAVSRVITRDGISYEVKIVDGNNLDNFYAFIHTTEIGFATKGNNSVNHPILEMFSNVSNQNVLCACYIDSTRTSILNRNASNHVAFILDVNNSNQHVGYSLDLNSMSKTTETLVAEYFGTLMGTEEARSGTTLQTQREYISGKLKQKLYPDNPNADALYAQRLNNIRESLGDTTMSMENLTEIDPEFARMYQELFAEGEILHNGDAWNEVIVSNPTISAICTTDIGNIPIEYLQMAQEQDLPIVILY